MPLDAVLYLLAGGLLLAVGLTVLHFSRRPAPTPADPGHRVREARTSAQQWTPTGGILRQATAPHPRPAALSKSPDTGRRASTPPRPAAPRPASAAPRPARRSSTVDDYTRSIPAYATPTWADSSTGGSCSPSSSSSGSSSSSSDSGGGSCGGGGGGE